jgi:transcriptional regulator
MYLPSHFAQTNPAVLHALVRQHPLGTLITVDAEGNPVADELPFVLDVPDVPGEPGSSPRAPNSPGPWGTLRGHVARANPLWRTHPAATRPVLVIFRGPQAYVSPSWYPGKAEHGKVVPTWNYGVVQAQGTLRVHDGEPDWLRAQLHDLTNSQEAHRPAPWQVGDAPPDYVAQMMRAIVGLEITLTQLTGKYKYSQNHPPSSRAGVAAGLHAEPGEQARLVAGMVGHDLSKD